jgi:gliding motility-associated-like protein
MNYKFFLYLLIASFLLSSKVYGQTADITEGCIGMKVQFNSPSSGNWDFGDGKSSGLQNPINTYTQSGNYTVKYNGNPTGITIKVSRKPEIIITASPTKGCTPLLVKFTAKLTYPLPAGVTVDNTSIVWNYQDGNNSTNTLNPSYTYINASVKDVGFFLKFNQNGNTSCEKIDTLLTKLIKATAKPQINFTPSSSSACTAPLNVTFTNNTTSTQPITYKWDFGNGKKSTNIQGEPQTYTKDGKYFVKLIVTDDNECVDSISKVINIGKPVADFEELNKKDTACIPNEFNPSSIITLINKSTSGSYSWKFDAGTSIPSSNQTNPGPISFSTIGKHSVTLTVNTNGCSDDTTIFIFVEEPKIDIAINRSYSCRDTLTSFYKIKNITNAGPVATYLWTFPEFSKSKKAKAFPSNTNTATPKCFYNTFDSTYHVRGINIDEVSCQIITKAGCKSNISKTVDTISEMWARIIPDKHEGCENLSITFSDSSSSHMKSKIDEWQWNFGDGTVQTLNSKTTPIHTYASPGIYKAYLIIKDNDYNCSDTSWLTEIRLGKSNLPIDFTISNNQICKGDKVTFTNTTPPAEIAKVNAWNYSSNLEHLSSCFQNKDGEFQFNDSIGTHKITLAAEYNGCYSYISKNLDVIGQKADFDYVQDCKTPHLLKLIDKSKGNGTTLWKINGNFYTLSINTTNDLSQLSPKINFGDVTIQQIKVAGACANDTSTTVFHYGVVKSNFILTDNNGGILPTTPSGEIILGDASTGQKYKYDAQDSKDIYAQDCYRGFTLLQEGNRPRVWTLAKDSLLVYKKNPSIGADDQEIKIIARNQNNCVDTSKVTIRIFDLTPSFITTYKNKITNSYEVVKKVCLPTTLSFASSSSADSTIKEYEWKFSDGKSKNGINITHDFDESAAINDTLRITLTITDKNGFKKSVDSLIPVYKPKATITSIPALNSSDTTVYICDGNTVNFNATSAQALTYKWFFKNDTVSRNDNFNTVKLYVPKGKNVITDTILLYFKEQSSGCIGRTYCKINIEANPKPIILSSIKNGIGCGNPSFNANFKDSSILNRPCSYNWDLGVNNITSQNSTASYSYDKGKYQIKLTLTTQANKCTKDTTVKFEVVSPTANFTVNKNNICQGEELIFTMTNASSDVASHRWDFGDGVIKINENPTKHAYTYVPPSGKTIATLFVENNGCSNPYYQDILMHYVHADFEITDLGSNIQNDTVTCIGDAFSFINTSVNSDVYKWEYDAKTTVSKDVDSYVFPKEDTFNIHLYVTSNAFGCKDDTVRQVIVSKKPSVKGYIEPVCKGAGPIKLSTMDTLKNHVYTWSPSSLTPIKNTVYTVTITDTINHCESKNDVLAVIVEDIDKIIWDTTIIIGDKIPLPIDNQYGTIDFTWNPTVGLSCLQCPTPKIQPLKDIEYNVFMKDNKNCNFSNTGYFKIIVKPETHIKLPTTFTPNGDGVNDMIYVKGWGIKTLESFEIYNRWGELIFKTNNVDEGWDGYYKGELQNNDVYAFKVIGTSWKVDPTTGQDGKLTKEGYIHLMR